MKYKFDNEAFSKKVKQMRIIEKSINLRKAAKEIGIDHTAIHRAEHGIEPNLLNYYALCKWIGADMSEFIKKAK
jgi:DNA-binding XRE family transcriptional regulator